MLKSLLIFAIATLPLHALEKPREVIDITEGPPYYDANQGPKAYPYYIPDGSLQYPYSYSENSLDNECDYEEYPGIAYENSISTIKVVTTVVVGAIVVAVIAIVITNTPGGCCHGVKNAH